MTTKQQAEVVLSIAKSVITTATPASAVIAFNDAAALHRRGEHHFAARRALRSLEFSVGAFSEPFQRAKLVLG